MGFLSDPKLTWNGLPNDQIEWLSAHHDLNWTRSWPSGDFDLTCSDLTKRGNTWLVLLDPIKEHLEWQGIIPCLPYVNQGKPKAMLQYNMHIQWHILAYIKIQLITLNNTVNNFVTGHTESCLQQLVLVFPSCGLPHFSVQLGRETEGGRCQRGG